MATQSSPPAVEAAISRAADATGGRETYDALSLTVPDMAARYTLNHRSTDGRYKRNG